VSNADFTQLPFLNRKRGSVGIDEKIPEVLQDYQPEAAAAI